MSDHAVLSPSAAERWTACPGSVELSRGLPDTDSLASRNGTWAHECAALRLNAKSPRDREAYRTLEGLPATLAMCVDSYVGYVLALRAIYGGDLYIEERVELLQDWCWGTADAILVARADDGSLHLHVVDLKTGGGHFVPAVGNRQLAVYGAAALQRLPQEPRVAKVSLHIVQPAWPDPDGNIARVWHTTPAELEQFLAPTMAVARRVAAGETNLPLQPGGHCTFCKARSTCPALRAQVESAVQTSFANAPVVEPPEPRTMTPEQLAKVLGAAALIETWLAAVRETAHANAIAGTKVPGYKLVEKIGNRRWTDETAAADALRAAGVDPYVEPKLVTPAEAERRVGRGRRALLEPLTTRPTTGVALVPEHDKRPAIAASVAASFQNTALPNDPNDC